MDGFFRNSRDKPPPAGKIVTDTPIGKLTADQGSKNRASSDTTFTDAVQVVVKLTLETFQQEINRKQLYYHGIDHVEGVSRRAQLIFDTVIPFYGQKADAYIDWDRQRQLLHLSAIAHDMLQIFRPQIAPHTSRQRRSGESEKATIQKLLSFIKDINPSKEDVSAYFQPNDIRILEEAIEATVCLYDANESLIYQPWLYAEHRNGQPISLVARALALADIGTLGIDGIEAYQKEGALLLLEENLDIIPFLKDESEFDQTFRENVRQRLLKRARFEIEFAKGRLNRLDEELAGLPEEAIFQLKQSVFKHLTAETIRTLKTITPTDGKTSLLDLLNYFQIKQQIR